MANTQAEENVSEWAALDTLGEEDVIEVADDVHIEIEEAPVGPSYQELSRKSRDLMMQLRAEQVRFKELENVLGKLEGLVFKRDGEYRKLLPTSYGFISTLVPEQDLKVQARKDASSLVVAELRQLIDRIGQ